MPGGKGYTMGSVKYMTREDTQLVAEVIRRKRIRASMGDGFVVDDGTVDLSSKILAERLANRRVG